jgi:hypothetical protein
VARHPDRPSWRAPGGRCRDPSPDRRRPVRARALRPGSSGDLFPFGVGVSRTQFAYALAIPLLVVLLGRVAPGGSPAWQHASSPSPA